MLKTAKDRTWALNRYKLQTHLTNLHEDPAPVLLDPDQNCSLLQATLCPELAVSEEFCDLLMGNLTPLLFPFLFPQLPYIIYIDK